MPDSSSCVAYNGSNVSNNESTTATSNTRSADKYNRSYSLNRYLADQNHPPGQSAQNPSERKQRMQEQLHSFQTKFSPSGEASNDN
ncbi:hypothetical protein TrVFT333_009669 [Trichoderma virens FT-333]|nr:hypothetical protein TrVFT333_009669 [Trichoderma virens FT-333]